MARLGLGSHLYEATIFLLTVPLIPRKAPLDAPLAFESPLMRSSPLSALLHRPLHFRGPDTKHWRNGQRERSWRLPDPTPILAQASPIFLRTTQREASGP
ncbi:hypothetical protein M408DRAFT_27521 [Serendipita vermifera MAFF 305830]|uniref:Uncharacterized protein n=1 Tax=Serendipita vermifera MAFF 305830 TaxID=933852 RepID=A0A0C3AX41_SERVB|nr:hypothetical protein M408DRAFT_27521 [Serendipita vermifera MAFF 305830]